MKRDLIRGVMILNEIHVQIARTVINAQVFDGLSEQIMELKDIILENAMPEEVIEADETKEIPEIDWDLLLSKKLDGC